MATIPAPPALIGATIATTRVSLVGTQRHRRIPLPGDLLRFSAMPRQVVTAWLGLWERIPERPL